MCAACSNESVTQKYREQRKLDNVDEFIFSDCFGGDAEVLDQK